MRMKMKALGLCLGAFLAAAIGSCASQREGPRGGPGSMGPQGSGGPTRIEGLVAEFSGNTLSIAGASGKTKVTIDEATSIMRAKAASLSDIAVGKWLEVKGAPSGSSSSIRAAELRVSDERLARAPEGGMGPGSSGGPGGGQGGGQGGGPGGGDQLSPPGGGQGGGPGGPQGGPSPTQSPEYSGKVESVDGNTVVISISGFGKTKQVSIVVDRDTQILKLSKATIDALAQGAQVMVLGNARDGNAVVAARIEVKG
jgi:hypothetical protein